ncbi:MAG TPA: hypothetical protein VKN64_07640 [Halanaerobiales bacterium]|nr:hypothetical protein [Halanaerobiales bacterium]
MNKVKPGQDKEHLRKEYRDIIFKSGYYEDLSYDAQMIYIYLKDLFIENYEQDYPEQITDGFVKFKDFIEEYGEEMFDAFNVEGNYEETRFSMLNAIKELEDNKLITVVLLKDADNKPIILLYLQDINLSYKEKVLDSMLKEMFYNEYKKRKQH